MTNISCGTCFFGVPVKGKDGVLDFTMRECHAHPAQVTIVPVPIGPAAIELKALAAYPVRSKDDWCGEFMKPAGLGIADT